MYAVNTVLVSVSDRLPARGRRRYGFIAAAVTVFLFLTFRSTNDLFLGKSPVFVGYGADKSSAFLHVIIPANHKDVNLCKTMLSAALTGYPTPTLINWGAEVMDNNPIAEGSHIAKFSGILKYLQNLSPEHDNDLVLLVNGDDTWFQLRPSTLIERFHEINRAANARIRQKIGEETARLWGIEQSIIFSAQKRCWPWKADDPPCYAVPESSLPRDIYGPETDTNIGLGKNPYVKFRQRYLNPGDAMGRVSAMRSLFRRAMEEANKSGNSGSDQMIFNQIFGDQEFQREVIRRRSLPWLERWREWREGKSIIDAHPTHHVRKHRSGNPDEFGVGLDYASLIGHATVFAEEDAAWVKHNNPTQMNEVSKELAIDTMRVKELAKDISQSQPPFRVAATLPGTSFPDDKSWTDVPLYTNMWTDVVPGLIHHSAQPDGLRSLPVSMWDQMWYHNHSRALYESITAGPVGPVAVVNDSKEQSWWSPIVQKGGAQPDNGEFIEWRELCSDYDAEIFRDLL